MSAAHKQALEALELVAETPEVRGGVFVLDQQDMAFVRKAVIALRNAPPTASMDNFEHVIQWVRDSYQDHSISSLCDGLRATYYALCRPTETTGAAS